MLDQIRGQNGKILLAGLADVTAGIITDLLMAPEAGKTTRQNFSKSALAVSAHFRKALKKNNKGKGAKGKKEK